MQQTHEHHLLIPLPSCRCWGRQRAEPAPPPNAFGEGGGSRCSGSEEAGPGVNQLWIQVSEAGLAETRVNDDKLDLDSGDL